MSRLRVAAAVAIAAFLIQAPLDAALTAEQRQLNIQSFEYVWTTIRDKHWQTKPSGLDWQAIHAEFRPKIEAASSMDDARGVLNQMLDRLHETHFAVVPGEIYSNVDAAHPGDQTAGIDVRVVAGQVLVTSVEPDSSAFLQGVRPGWAILKIGDTDLAPLVAQLERTYAGSTLHDLMLRRAILARLDRDQPDRAKEAPLQVEFLAGDNQPVSKSLTLGPPRASASNSAT